MRRLAVVCLVLLPWAANAATPEDARSFVERILTAKYEGLHETMSADMQAAMTPEAMRDFHDLLLAGNGGLREIEEAWHEDDVGEYSRFRVPVQFGSAKLDLRVVFDANDTVAGMFILPHAPRPAPAGTTAPATVDAIAGHWEGAIETPGVKLTVLVDLAFRDGAWNGTCDVPMQGGTEIPLGGIRVDDEGIAFTMVGIPGDPTFEGTLRDGEIVGTFTQAGQSFPFRLGRDAVAGPDRPQEPKPPFPYDEEEIALESGEVRLAGTLTLPKGDGPHPAALLLSGSGAQDRNSTLLGHKPFLLIADHLTRAGIAVLRMDDRGVGDSSGSTTDATIDDLVADALAAVRLLAERDDIDGTKVGLVGHSQGGIVGPLAASRSEDVAFVVMLAGTGVPGSEVLVRQLELILDKSGMPAEQIRAVSTEQRKLVDLILAGAEEGAMREQFRKLVRAQSPGGDPDEDPTGTIPVEAIASPWFRSFLAHDPRLPLRKVRVPVLALYGELDLQVEPAQNMPAVRASLAAAENDDATVEELPGLNHLFQEAFLGTPAEYYTIEQTMSPVALDKIRDWILARFGPPTSPEER